MTASLSTSLNHHWRRFYDSRKGYALFWLCMYLLTMAVGASIFFYQIPLPQNQLVLEDVAYQVSDVQSPGQLATQGWQPVSLPDSWQARQLSAKNVWYRGRITLSQQPGQLWAVLIPELKMNAAVYLNGELLGSGGRFSDPVARNWMTPLLFSIPAGLLNRGENTLHIRVKSDPVGSGQLAALHIGPYEGVDGGLAYAYRIHYLFRISSIQLLTTMLLIMGMLIAFLWFVRRRETYYGYYALAVTIWGLHNFNIFMVNIPVSTRLWDWLAYTSIAYYTFLAMVFIHRFLGVYHPLRERIVVGGGMLAAFALLLPGEELFYWLVFNLWYPFVFTVGFYIMVYTCIHAWRRQSMELQFLTASGAITLLYAQHDLLLIHGIVDWQDGFYIQYAAAVLLSLFSFILMRRFARSLNEVDALNRDLEKRVAEKGRQLEASFMQVRKMENARILSDERERMTRDIHDGMGGHLVSTLALVESGKADMTDVANALKESLTDLRLMIDSMDIEEDELDTLLGMFRMRIEPRLKNSRITLRWKVSDLPPINQFGPREALHILRILQEAITNIIKHTEADRIHLSTYPAHGDNGEQTVVIELRDNGGGISSDYSPGKGMKNMHRRAREAGAKLLIDSDNEGTCVFIILHAAA